MFQFTRLSSLAYVLGQRHPSDDGWVAPLGYPRLSSLDSSPRLFVVMPRPSSPLNTRASTMRPFLFYPSSSEQNKPYVYFLVIVSILLLRCLRQHKRPDIIRAACPLDTVFCLVLLAAHVVCHNCVFLLYTPSKVLSSIMPIARHHKTLTSYNGIMRPQDIRRQGPPRNKKSYVQFMLTFIIMLATIATYLPLRLWST